MTKGIRNEIVKQIINLGDRLKIEYASSETNFDLYTQKLLNLLKSEKASVAFIFRDGTIQKHIISRSELKPIFEMLKNDPLNFNARIRTDSGELDTIKIEKKTFKFQGFEEPFIYVEE